MWVPLHSRWIQPNWASKGLWTAQYVIQLSHLCRPAMYTHYSSCHFCWLIHSFLAKYFICGSQSSNYFTTFKYNLRQKYHAPQARLDRASNVWPPDHGSHWDACSNHQAISDVCYLQVTEQQLYYSEVLSLSALTHTYPRKPLRKI